MSGASPYQSLSDTQKNKALNNVATLVNTFFWTSLVYTDLNTWIAGSHIYKTIFFKNKFNNFLLFRVMTSKPNGFGIMVLFHSIIAYSWIFLGNGWIYIELQWNSKIIWRCVGPPCTVCLNMWVPPSGFFFL